MPPQFATLLCIFLIVFLFWVDRKRNDGVSKAIWIPFIWIFLSASRYASQWFDLGAVESGTGDAYIEGSPVDRVVFELLIVIGLYVLGKRKLNWPQFFKENKIIWLYFVLGLISLLWSDFPIVSLKRMIKASGTVVMALVVLTEDRPYLALGIILKRLAFVLLPLSALFIKFYPDLGRAYDAAGSPMYTGVCFQKNGLGQLCLLSALFFSWHILFVRQDFSLRLHVATYIIMLPLLVWLLYMAHSATSLACVIAVVAIFIIAKHTAMRNNPRRIIFLALVSIVAYLLLEQVFDVKEAIIAMLGRRPDFTDRVNVWERYLAMVKNPIIGYGYEVFYTSIMAKGMVKDFTSAHNGYLEMYMNLGICGLIFIAGWIVTGIKKVWNHLPVDYPAAILRFAIIVAVVLYNWTEAGFAGTSNIWMFLFLAVISPPGKKIARDKVD